jgi:septal ring factor EnvC (AmiA/AmiB activator)
MQEARNEVQSWVVELSQSLNDIKGRKEEVSTEFDMARARFKSITTDIANARSSIDKANKMIEKARDMINKAEVVLEKSFPLYETDNVYLEGLESEKIVFRTEETRISQELAVAEARLAVKTTDLTEEMKQRVALKAEEERRHRILLVKDKLKSYVVPQA